MKTQQVDIANKMVFIENSKTPTGVSEVPLTDIAADALPGAVEHRRPEPVVVPEFT